MHLVIIIHEKYVSYRLGIETSGSILHDGTLSTLRAKIRYILHFVPHTTEEIIFD